MDADAVAEVIAWLVSRDTSALEVTAGVKDQVMHGATFVVRVPGDTEHVVSVTPAGSLCPCGVSYGGLKIPHARNDHNFGAVEAARAEAIATGDALE